MLANIGKKWNDCKSDIDKNHCNETNAEVSGSSLPFLGGVVRKVPGKSVPFEDGTLSHAEP